MDITVARNFPSEAESHEAFAALQDEIFGTFGQRSPSPPVLRCRNATQTSVVLEWDPIQLATAELRSLSLYRNGTKAGNIPRPLETLSTKISGLAVDTEYTFHLVLRTSAGTYSSQKLTVATHKMTDLSGITVTPGVLPAPLRDSLERAIDRIGAKQADTVRIDTTHFVCTEGKGQQWERAVEMNIPVVRPEWVQGCEREGRIVGVREYYLNADPRLRQIGQGVKAQQQQQQQQQQQPQTPQSPLSSQDEPRPSDHQRPDSTRIPDRTSSAHHDAEDEAGAQDVDSNKYGGKADRMRQPTTPPIPSPKSNGDYASSDDEGGSPDPKSTAGDDEPKVRVEDRPRLGKSIVADGDEALNGDATTKTDRLQEHAPGGQDAASKARGPEGDGESFSEVAL